MRRIGWACRSPPTAGTSVGYANAGVDAIEHIWSVGYSSIPYAPARRKLAEDRLGGVIDQELAGAYYQTENYDAVIGAMVEHSVAWTPTIAKWLRPLVAERGALQRKRKPDLERLRMPIFPPRCAR